jgi:hypothetical protein
MNIVVRMFGLLIGVLVILFGIAVLNDALVGTGPCRANCNLYTSLIEIFGQRAFNKLVGAAWVVGGIGFCMAALLVKRDGQSMSQTKGPSKGKRGKQKSEKN